jgi:hypothetical protein
VAQTGKVTARPRSRIYKMYDRESILELTLSHAPEEEIVHEEGFIELAKVQTDISSVVRGVAGEIFSDLACCVAPCWRVDGL